MAAKKILIWPKTLANLMKRKSELEKDSGIKGIRIPMTRWLHYISTKPIDVDISIKKLASRKFKLENHVQKY